MRKSPPESFWRGFFVSEGSDLKGRRRSRRSMGAVFAKGCRHGRRAGILCGRGLRARIRRLRRGDALQGARAGDDEAASFESLGRHFAAGRGRKTRRHGESVRPSRKKKPFAGRAFRAAPGLCLRARACGERPPSPSEGRKEGNQCIMEGSHRLSCGKATMSPTHTNRPTT